MRGDSIGYNTLLIEQNCKEWASNTQDEVDMDRALRLACELAAQQYANAGAGFGRYGGPLEGTPRHKARYSDPILLEDEG